MSPCRNGLGVRSCVVGDVAAERETVQGRSDNQRPLPFNLEQFTAVHVVESVVLKNHVVELRVLYPRTCADVELLLVALAPEHIVPYNKVAAVRSAGVSIDEERSWFIERDVV